MSEVLLLHSSCVICRATAGEFTSEQTLLVVVAMVLSDADPDQVVKDLCHVHLRMVEEA